MSSTPIRPRAAAKTAPDAPDYDPIGGLLAVLVPGLGHFLRGHRARGVYAFVGVMGMFCGGLLIGGIDVIDRREDRVWFVGQALTGPIAFGVDWVHQTHFKAYEQLDGPTGQSRYRSGYPDEARQYNDQRGRYEWVAAPGARPPNATAVTTIKDIGMLYCTLAGMLNLIVILDALMPGKLVSSSPTRPAPRARVEPEAEPEADGSGEPTDPDDNASDDNAGGAGARADSEKGGAS